MRQESIPDQGSSLNERVLFYRGNILVDAVFEKLSAMSAAELRELSEALPLPAGNARNLPILPAYLPKSGYVKNTAKYVMGPVGLDKISAPLSAQLVDFNASAEVALGTYQTSDGVATLMLIAYPTPQLAAEHLRTDRCRHPGQADDASRKSDRDCGADFREAHRSYRGDRNRRDFARRSARSLECGELRSRCHLEREHLSGQEK